MTVSSSKILTDILFAIVSVFIALYFLRVKSRGNTQSELKKYKSLKAYSWLRLAFTGEFLVIVSIGAATAVLQVLLDIIFISAGHVIPALEVTLFFVDFIGSVISIYFIYKLYKKWEQQ